MPWGQHCLHILNRILNILPILLLQGQQLHMRLMIHKEIMMMPFIHILQILQIVFEWWKSNVCPLPFSNHLFIVLIAELCQRALLLLLPRHQIYCINVYFIFVYLISAFTFLGKAKGFGGRKDRWLLWGYSGFRCGFLIVVMIVCFEWRFNQSTVWLG